MKMQFFFSSFYQGPVQIYNGPSFLRLSSTKEKLIPVCKPLYGFIKCSKVIVENGDSSVNFSMVNYSNFLNIQGVQNY